MAVSEQLELLVWEKRCKEVERNPVPNIFRSPSVDIFDLDEREILVTFPRRPDFACNCITAFQSVALDLLSGNVDVIRTVEIVVI